MGLNDEWRGGAMRARSSRCVDPFHACCNSSRSVRANKADVFELAAGGLFLTQGAAVTVVGKAADTVVVAHGAAAAE